MTGRKPFAQLVSLVLLAGVFALSLSACGGGSKPVTKPGDEMTVTPPSDNRAPVIERTFEDVTLTLDGSTSQWESGDISAYFSDPDGDKLEYQAEARAINVEVVDVTFGQTGSLIVRAAAAGTATMTITATDPAGLTATQSFTVTVNDGTAPGPDHADTPAGATPVVSGETIEGSIDSPDDVDYFRLELTEPGTVIATITAEPGVEIAIVDANGKVLANAVTASEATAAVTTNKGVLYLKVIYGLLKETKKIPYKVITRVIDNLETAINLVRKIPNYSIGVGPVGVSVDLREYFQPPSGGRPTYKVAVSLGVLQVRLEGSTLNLSALPSASPGSVITVTVSAELQNLDGLPLAMPVPGTAIVLPPGTLRAVDVFTVTIGGGPRQIKGTDLSVSVAQGGEVMIRLTDYIEDPAGRALTFAHGALPTGFGVTTDGAEWTIAVAADVKKDTYSLPVTATDGDNRSKDFIFRVDVSLANMDCYHIDPPDTFSGECLNGLPHGQGTLTRYGVDGSVSSRDEGEFREGRLHGQGAYTLYFQHDGDYARWEGEFREGRLYGQGTYTNYRVDGSVSSRDEGEFRGGGGLHGQGISTSYRVDGSVSYRDEGEFREGGLHGQGTYTNYYSNGLVENRYEGEWRDSAKHGQGTDTYYYEDGSISERYEGEFRGNFVWNGTRTRYDFSGSSTIETCREGQCS